MPVISTNNAANSALNYLNQNSATEANLLSQLASGSRIVKASDDAAGLAIGTQLNAAVAVYQQDAVNVQQGSSILQVADGAMSQIGNVLQRMLVLATEAASGQVGSTQRADIQAEFTQLQSEINTIATSTTYGGQTVINAADSFASATAFLVGTTSTDSISITISAADATTLGVNALSASDTATAAAAMTAINTAITTLTGNRATIGAYESQFNFSNQVIATNIQNTQAAASVIMDADVAAVKAQLSATDVKTQASVAALAQAAQLPQELLKLIQS